VDITSLHDVCIFLITYSQQKIRSQVIRPNTLILKKQLYIKAGNFKYWTFWQQLFMRVPPGGKGATPCGQGGKAPLKLERFVQNTT